jgi:IS5 family transposase
MSRRKKDTQGRLEFQESSLAVTREYFAKYEWISQILDETPEMLDLVHKDLQEALEEERKERGCEQRKRCEYSSDNVLRVIVVQQVEDLSLRQTVIRVDDSHFLRRFTRLYDATMMDFSVLCRLRNAIRPKTWERVNAALASYAVEEGWISGEKLRMDTTAVETNIHWPSDSGLLWDTYRVLARLIETARELHPASAGKGRVRLKTTKRHFTKIARTARGGRNKAKLPGLYRPLIDAVEGILAWSAQAAERLERLAQRSTVSALVAEHANCIAGEIRHFHKLGERVLHQTRERVFEGKTVPPDQKVFSIFEEHTEMLVRGKASRNIEYGHMVNFEQVGEKFITHYQVFAKKPNEHLLLPEALERHRELFGQYPDQAAADKGYWPGKDGLPDLEKKVRVVSIGKMGKRTEDEDEREWHPEFRQGQKFRAGIEGTIAFLKRVLGLARCFRKGWRHFVANVGATVFAHNLLILARC